MTNPDREAFEKHWTENGDGSPTAMAEGAYVCDPVHEHWTTWQAALTAERAANQTDANSLSDSTERTCTMLCTQCGYWMPLPEPQHAVAEALGSDDPKPANQTDKAQRLFMAATDMIYAVENGLSSDDELSKLRDATVAYAAPVAAIKT